MLALAEYRDDLHSCGHPLSDTTDPSAEGRYTAPLPIRCHACDAIEIKQEEYKEATRPRALLWRAERRD
jgi:hypothetical protein